MAALVLSDLGTVKLTCRVAAASYRAIAVRIARDVSKNGAPEEIRTPDPQIRSLIEPIEIIRVRYRKGRLSRLSLEFSMHRFKARYRTERCSNLGGISPAKTEIIA
jgi:hypothetical protein